MSHLGGVLIRRRVWLASTGGDPRTAIQAGTQSHARARLFLYRTPRSPLHHCHSREIVESSVSSRALNRASSRSPWVPRSPLHHCQKGAAFRIVALSVSDGRRWHPCCPRPTGRRSAPRRALSLMPAAACVGCARGGATGSGIGIREPCAGPKLRVRRRLPIREADRRVRARAGARKHPSTPC